MSRAPRVRLHRIGGPHVLGTLGNGTSRVLGLRPHVVRVADDTWAQMRIVSRRTLPRGKASGLYRDSHGAPPAHTSGLRQRRGLAPGAGASGLGIPGLPGLFDRRPVPGYAPGPVSTAEFDSLLGSLGWAGVNPELGSSRNSVPAPGSTGAQHRSLAGPVSNLGPWGIRTFKSELSSPRLHYSWRCDPRPVGPSPASVRRHPPSAIAAGIRCAS